MTRLRWRDRGEGLGRNGKFQKKDGEMKKQRNQNREKKKKLLNDKGKTKKQRDRDRETVRVKGRGEGRERAAASRYDIDKYSGKLNADKISVIHQSHDRSHTITIY